MFINLSNHPVDNWSSEQVAEARKYGEIVDVEFPTIKPSYDAEFIRMLALNYALRIVDKYGSDLTVHVMGEMTFTYNLVNALKDAGITCLASTTERNTIITPDGKKISEFKFVQFREY